VSRRYEKRSVVLTTNLTFSDWPTVFPNAACTTALIDRLVHHSDHLGQELPGSRGRGGEAHPPQAQVMTRRPVRIPALSRERQQRGGTVTLRLRTRAPADLELWDVAREAGFFQEVFRRRLEVTVRSSRGSARPRRAGATGSS
jgi:hypothetical protein